MLAILNTLPPSHNNPSPSSPPRALSISPKIKGMILTGLINKHTTKPKQYSKQQLLFRWYRKVKVEAIREQVMVRVMAQQRISEVSFLYRVRMWVSRDKTDRQQQEGMGMERERRQRGREMGGRLREDGEWNGDTHEEWRKQDMRICVSGIEQKNKEKIENDKQIVQAQINDQNQLTQPNFQSLNQSKQPTSNLSIPQPQPQIPQKSPSNHRSSQASHAPNSQRELSQIDIFEQFDKRLSSIRSRLLVSGLRACEMMILKVSYRRKMEGFGKILSRL